MSHAESDPHRKVIPIMPGAASAAEGKAIAADPELVSLYEAHRKIYPRSVTGLIETQRRDRIDGRIDRRNPRRRGIHEFDRRHRARS